MHTVAACVPPPGRVNDTEPQLASDEPQSPAPVQNAVHLCDVTVPMVCVRQIPVAHPPTAGSQSTPKALLPAGVGPHARSMRLAPEFELA